MKSKLSTKVLGIVVTLATLASLLVGLTAAPAGVSAATNQMTFTPISLPSNIGNTLGGERYSTFSGATSSTPDSYISNPSIDSVVVSADGNSIYAWDSTNKALYYSSNAGKSFTSIGINVNSTFVAMDISPKFATDGVVVLANTGEVWVISGGLANIAVVQQATLTSLLESGTITSMDVGSLYGSGVTTIAIGITGNGVLHAYSNVLEFQMSSNILGSNWTEVGATSTGAGNGFMKYADVGQGTFDPNVIAVKFSPNFQSDATLMAVYTNSVAGGTFLAAANGAQPWNSAMLPTATVLPASATLGDVVGKATVGLGTDYFGLTSGVVLVGTAGLVNHLAPATPVLANGVFIVKNWLAGSTASSNVILGGVTLSGTNDVPVSGIAISGPIATASVVVSTPGTTNLNITTAVTASTVTWVGSAGYRGPTGTAVTSMYYGGTNNAKLVVSSNGTNGAINVSADNANTFNQVGLINLTAFPTGYSGFSEVAATNWYVRVANGLFQSTDSGVSWTRIFGNAWNSAYINGFNRSQSFATNNTFIITNGTQVALITSNGGSTYTPVGLAVTSLGGLSMIENDAYYYYSGSSLTGSNAAFYNSTRAYTNATFTPAMSGAINSVSRSGKDATHMTYAIGTTVGQIYQSTDGGVTFTTVGTWPGATTDKISVSYGPDGTLWAFANGTTNAAPALQSAGIYKWIPATSTWLNINVTVPVSGWTIAGDGTAYATGDFLNNLTTPWAGTYLGGGVFRSLNYNDLNPDGSSAAKWGNGVVGSVTPFMPTATGEINGTSFPNGQATATIGSAAVGYPGGTPVGLVGYPNGQTSAASAQLSYTSGVSVLASAATGNTLLITEKTSTVSASQVNVVIYQFVDTSSAGPVVVSPKDKTVLATDTSAAMTWTALNGPSGGSTASSTNYRVQVTASTDFSGGTTPVFDTNNQISGSPTPQNMDTYVAGNTNASMGINPGAPTYALKSGTNYSWRVMAVSPLPSRWTTSTFTTALSAVTNPTQNNSFPANGATGIDVNTTFTWPAVSGSNVTYEFVIAEETGQTDKFAIIDYSATTPTNATPLRETLKYNTQYWWRVRATNGSTTSAWSTYFFTTAAAPATTTTGGGSGTIVLPTPTSTIITITNPVTSFTITQPSNNNNSIPPALLWAVIAIGAILIIAVIVLIVRTRRIP